MQCPICKGLLREGSKAVSCSFCSFIVWKSICRRPMSRLELETLLTNGKTPVLTGFYSRKGKQFSAALYLENGKVCFEFPEQQKEEASRPLTARIRVEAPSSGMARVNIKGPLDWHCAADFGLVPARLVECYMATASAKWLHYYLGNQSKSTELFFSCNNLDFVRYLLRERKPRSKEIQFALKELLQALEPFATWNVIYEKRKRVKLQGGPDADRFPLGLFPWAEIATKEDGNTIKISLPQCLALRAQFMASFRTATVEQSSDNFMLPETAKSVFIAWHNKVKALLPSQKRDNHE